MYCTRCGVELNDAVNYCSNCGTATVNAPRLVAGPVKRLMRSRHNSRIGGVCGGLGEYLDIDPTLIRLLFVCLFFLPLLPGVLLGYVIAWIVLPKEPEVYPVQAQFVARPA